MTAAVVHIAGIRAQVGDRVRQRCGWCGALLVDEDLTRLVVLAGRDPTQVMWQPGRLIRVDGPMSIELPPTGELPDGCCADIDPDVTR